MHLAEDQVILIDLPIPVQIEIGVVLGIAQYRLVGASAVEVALIARPDVPIAVKVPRAIACRAFSMPPADTTS
jgi:hypothetical protein